MPNFQSSVGPAASCDWCCFTIMLSKHENGTNGMIDWFSTEIGLILRTWGGFPSSILLLLKIYCGQHVMRRPWIRRGPQEMHGQNRSPVQGFKIASGICIMNRMNQWWVVNVFFLWHGWGERCSSRCPEVQKWGTMPRCAKIFVLFT